MMSHYMLTAVRLVVLMVMSLISTLFVKFLQ